MSESRDPGSITSDTKPNGTPSGSVSPKLARGTCLERYVILDVLGEGGMSVVYKAYDPELDRPIALKLLRAAPNSDASRSRRDRLVREAQALAKLSHPNIVSVFDVGTFGGDVFIAMEFVEGRTLRLFVEEERGNLGRILDTFLAAGEGLAAAHRAGLVHRDFKPDNVIIGDDGRTRVFDFGLVRSEPSSSPSQSGRTVVDGPATDAAGGRSLERTATTHPDRPDAVSTSGGHIPTQTPADGEGAAGAKGSNDRLHSPLTQDGSILGTPRYMSPEQHLGNTADARSDQFSFCVALYETLYGVRPFEGRTVGELSTNVTTGVLAPVPPKSQVPRWLRQVLLRGLSVVPDQRHPSMEALLSALRHDPRQARRKWLQAAAAALLVTAVAGGYAVIRHQQRTLCRGSERKLDGVWDAQRRAAVESAFAATGRPFARDAYRVVSETLDRYARDWTAMHTDTCEATRMRGEQSEELLDLRMQCLGQHLGDLRAEVELLSSADGKVVEKAVQVAQSLPPLSACADAAALRAPLRIPVDAAAQGRIEAMRSQLSRARALTAAGKYGESVKLADEVSAAARTLSYAPLDAEAAAILGKAQDLAGDYKGAEATLREGAVTALSGRRDDLAVAMWSTLVGVTGDHQGRYADGQQWARMARAMLGRMGASAILEGPLAIQECNVHQREGKYADGLRDCQRALTLATTAHGPDSIRVSEALNNLANVYYLQGRLKEALAHYQRSFAIKEKLLGLDHPQSAMTLANLGNVQADMGNHEQAVQMYERSIAIQEHSLGPQHPSLAVVLDNMGGELLLLGRYADALAAHQRAANILEKVVGANHPQFADALRNLGEVHRVQGHHSDALGYFQRSLAIHEATQGAAHPSVAADHCSIGETLLALGRLEEALTQERRALAIWEKALGAQHPYLAKALVAEGRVELARHHAAEALPLLERAVALRSASGGDPLELAAARFALASALWDASHDRARAHALAEEARKGYVAATTAVESKRELPRVMAWLEQH